MITPSKLLTKLRVRMENRIPHYDEYSDEFLITELENAIEKVAERRWVEPAELEDKFALKVVDIALYNINLIGGDFQTSHDENGVSRQFVSEKEILATITPKARAF